MDEEDLAELRESRKLVDETEEMDFGGTAAEKRRLAGEADEQECVCPVAHCNVFTDTCRTVRSRLPSLRRSLQHRRTALVRVY